jgi:hypothetical protein
MPDQLIQATPPFGSDPSGSTLPHQPVDLAVAEPQLGAAAVAVNRDVHVIHVIGSR